MNNEDYPQELSLLAFCYLTELKDAVRVLGVCKAWRALGADRTLWRHRNLPPALALLFARHNISTSFGLRLPFEEVLTVFDPSLCERDEGWWFATLLRAAVSERPVGDALRKQAVRLKMGPVSGDLNEAQNAVWTDIVTVFSENSAVTEIDCFAIRCKQLSHFKWLPRLREARVGLIDCGPRTIAEWWPELVSLSGSISLPEVYQELPLEAPLEHPLATLNVGLIGSDDDHSFVLAFPAIKSLEFADYRMSPHELFLKADVPFTNPNLEHLIVHMDEFEHPLEEIQRWDGPPSWSTQIQYSELRTLVLHVHLPVSEVVHPSTVNVGFTNVRACVLSMLRAAPRLRMLTVHGLGLDSMDPLHEPLFNAAVMDACHRHAALSTMQFSVRWNQMDIKDGEARRESIVGELSRGVGELVHSATVDWKEVWRQRLQHATITQQPSIEVYEMPLALLGVRDGWEISTLAGFAVTGDFSRHAVEYLSMRRVRV